METYRISDGLTEAELERFLPWLAQINPESLQSGRPAAPQVSLSWEKLEDPFINSLSTLSLT